MDIIRSPFASVKYEAARLYAFALTDRLNGNKPFLPPTPPTDLIDLVTRYIPGIQDYYAFGGRRWEELELATENYLKLGGLFEA